MKVDGLKQHTEAGSAHPWSTRVLARAGFDWLTVDLEHAPIAWDEAALMFALHRGQRVRAAGAGARGPHQAGLGRRHGGVMVPVVDTAEQAEAAVAAAEYRRVTGGAELRALSFGTTTADYYAHADDQTVVVVQIESPTGIANLRAICGAASTRSSIAPPTNSVIAHRGRPAVPGRARGRHRAGARAQRPGYPPGIVTYDADSALARRVRHDPDGGWPRRSPHDQQGDRGWCNGSPPSGTGADAALPPGSVGESGRGGQR